MRLERTLSARAFTLVEILIVVVILGILAAVVIPQFTNARVETSVSTLKSQLQTIRGQIEVYKARHNSLPPFGTTGTESDWDPLVNPTDENTYLLNVPYNPFTNSPGIGTVDATVYRDSPHKPDEFLAKPYPAKQLADLVKTILAR